MAKDRISVFKLTKENWGSSYQLTGWYEGVEKEMLLEVIFSGNITEHDPSRPAIWRTCVWGNDDRGVEIDCATREEAWDKFLAVLAMKYVTYDALIKMGFVNA